MKGLVWLWMLALSGCQARQYVVEETLSYDSSIGYHGTFDLYEPVGDTVRTSRPAIIAIHGGAWRSGDKAWGESFAQELCPFGYVVISINYRLSSNPNSTWPAQIDDVQKALRYVRLNAHRFRIDPERIASLGMSAGGHLATMIALRDSSGSAGARVKAAVNLDGEHDLTMQPEAVMADFDNIMTRVLGHAAPWSVAELRDISTVTFARPDVSLLTVHGAEDDNVYVSQGDRITSAVRTSGGEAEYVRIEGPAGKCHEECWKVPNARNAIHKFLDRHLSHDGNAFFEQQTGRPSPMRDGKR